MHKENLADFASKKYGQNFLKDETVLDKIMESIPYLEKEEHIVEIGPGLGDLTKRLIRNYNVVAYEIDNRLCPALNALQEKHKNFSVICDDVMNQWTNESLRESSYHLIANLPYYIATKIILKALRDPHCRSILVMVQKEVAEKFAAQRGEKSFSSLSVLTQKCGYGKLCFLVPPEAFVPAPKVDSAILLISKKQTLKDEGFEHFMKQCFVQPRKKLIKNLAKRHDLNRLKELFDHLDLKESIRPHETPLEIYEKLFEILKENDAREQLI